MILCVFKNSILVMGSWQHYTTSKSVSTTLLHVYLFLLLLERCGHGMFAEWDTTIDYHCLTRATVALLWAKRHTIQMFCRVYMAEGALFVQVSQPWRYASWFRRVQIHTCRDISLEMTVVLCTYYKCQIKDYMFQKELVKSPACIGP